MKTDYRDSNHNKHISAMKGAYIFFANGFEETEALAPIDVLRRGGVDIRIVPIYDDRTVTGSHRIPMIADMSFPEFLEEVRLEGTTAGDIMVFPGGMPGSTNLAACDRLMELMLDHYAAGGSVAAICAAPSVVLSKLPGLAGKTMTCYDGFEPALLGKGVKHTKEGVATDGNIITGRGAGHAVAFGLAILAHLKGKETADKVAASIML